MMRKFGGKERSSYLFQILFAVSKVSLSMKLQKSTQFGLYAILELARDPERQLSATDIAKIYSISSNHLAKVLRDLGRAGLV